MDRHEYEINQLINPKKDIVKSNSKHRDKIETLILGRNGILGGGDTPKQETFLWKMKWQGSTNLIFGKVENNTLTSYALSDSNPYFADEDGLIIGSSGISTMGFDYIVKPKLRELGITYDQYAFDTSSYSMNENVQNWQDFIELS